MISTTQSTDVFTKILYVEDDPAHARLVDVYLSDIPELKYEYQHVTSLKDAKEKLSSESGYSVVLLDLGLPDSNGLDTLSAMLHDFPEANIIVLTGQDDEELGLNAVKQGAQDYLVKGKIDEKILGTSLRYSIERNQIIGRLEEAQRIAKVGYWQYAPEDQFFTASQVVRQIFDVKQDRCDYHFLQTDNCPLGILVDVANEARSRKKLKKQLRIRLSDNSTRFVQVSCEASLSIEGHYVFNGVVQDITQQKRAEELRKARDVAQESAKVKEQIFANVSHEMRTPMNAIIGMTNLLFQTDLNAEQQEYVDTIKQSSQMLLGIINDILEVSSIQNKKLFFEEESFSLTDTLNTLTDTFNEKVNEKSLNFSIKKDPSIKWNLIGDALKLKQVLYNLLGNAIKFTDKGSVDLNVHLVEEGRGFVKLRFNVRDTGVGIPKDRLLEVFEPFTRIGVRERSTEGTGLGLSISKKLVEGQGGMIGVDSEEGVGSSFFFELSFGKGEKEGSGKELKVSKNKKIGNQFEVMVVEDHKMNQLVMQKTLEKQWSEVKVIIMQTGDEAIKYLEENTVDVILMDIQMPGRNGFETTEYIRKKMRPEVANIPILAMTAWQYGQSKDDYRKLGLDDYILKPFDPEQLFEKIEFFVNAGK